MRFEGKEMAEEFEAAFGFKIEDCTVQQLWFLTKFSKHVRMRCKSNVAFNNYMNQNFKGARFSVIQKEWKGATYPGLKIEAKGVSREECDDV